MRCVCWLLAFASSVFDYGWLSVAADSVRAMLPGGLYVAGVYLSASPAVLKRQDSSLDLLVAELAGGNRPGSVSQRDDAVAGGFCVLTLNTSTAPAVVLGRSVTREAATQPLIISAGGDMLGRLRWLRTSVDAVCEIDTAAADGGDGETASPAAVFAQVRRTLCSAVDAAVLVAAHADDPSVPVITAAAEADEPLASAVAASPHETAALSLYVRNIPPPQHAAAAAAQPGRLRLDGAALLLCAVHADAPLGPAALEHFRSDCARSCDARGDCLAEALGDAGGSFEGPATLGRLATVFSAMPARVLLRYRSAGADAVAATLLLSDFLEAGADGGGSGALLARLMELLSSRWSVPTLEIADAEPVSAAPTDAPDAAVPVARAPPPRAEPPLAGGVERKDVPLLWAVGLVLLALAFIVYRLATRAVAPAEL